MTTVNVYLTFYGNCKEAFDFYKSVFGGEFEYIGTFGEMPAQEGMPPLSSSVKDQIMHVSLRVGGDTVLMGSDKGEWGEPVKFGNNFSISILTDDTKEADRLFDALSKGGSVAMPMAKQFWGAYYGMLTDRFGINWMVNCDL